MYVNMLQMPLGAFDERGLTPFHYSLVTFGCLDIARTLLKERPQLISQKVSTAVS